jgi:hypothetical protein
MFLFVFCSHNVILGSYYSSFSEVASYAQNARLHIASIDFAYPGLAPLSCNPTTWFAKPQFVGVSICTALTATRLPFLKQSLSTWLVAEGINEVIIVDYKSSSNASFENMILHFNDSRIKHIKVSGPFETYSKDLKWLF